MLRRRAIAIIWSSAGFFVATVLVIAAAQVSYLKHAALDKTGRAAEQSVAGAEVAVNRSMLEMDALLAGLPQQLAPAVDAAGRLDRERASLIMTRAAERHMIVNGLALTELDGTVLAISRLLSYFDRVTLPPAITSKLPKPDDASLRISPPQPDAHTGEPAVWLLRPVDVAGRTLLAVAQVPVARWSPTMAPAGGVGDLVLTLEREDGLLVATSPPNAAIAGSQLPAGPLAGAALSGLAAEAESRFGGKPALLAARPLLYDGLRVAATAPLEAVLREWREVVDRIAAVTLAFVLLVVSAAAMIHWQLGRQLRARAEAARAKAVLDRALGAMADGFLLCDAEDRIVAWNERYAEMHPWLLPVLRVGDPFSNLLELAARNVIPDDRDGSARAAWQAQRLERHRSGRFEYDQELANGAVLQIVERRTPDGGIVSVYRDITRAERELRRAKLAAEAANEAKTRFLAAMSHEIRTPLNGVLGMNSLLSMTPLSSEQQRFVRTIESSGRTLLALINDILDVSRIEAGRMELELLDFDPVALIGEVTDSLRPKAAEKGLALVIRLPDDGLPALRGDPNRLRQVLFNLLGNALKFTPAGRVELEARAQAAEDGRVALQLSIHDTGIGIPPEVMPRLFERFAQADGSTARCYGGSGLGLAICREIVALMGGRIGVDSVPGRGSTFHVSVPLARAQAPLQVHQARPLSTGPSGLRVLVAEDNEVNQMVVVAMLAQMRHESHVVVDGAAAVSAARDGDWDCVLMDIQMPGMDGETAARRIRELPGARGRVPIIALTANALLEEQRAYLAAGMDDHVAKPIDMDTLRDTLRRVVASRAAEPMPA